VLDDSLLSSGIAPQSQPALRFYEGFRLAVADFERHARKRLYLRIFDSRGDSLTTASLLDELDALSPDLVVGDFYGAPLEQLARWAESRATPQVVPLSSSSQLVAWRQQVFLAHPTIYTHGAVSARYAFDSLGLRRVAVWTDSLPGTEALAEAFMNTFDTLGGEVIRLQVDSAFHPEMQDDIRSTLHSLRFQQVDGMYLPLLGQQETAGLILSQMRTMNLDYPVLGSPHWWSRYDNIDRDLKESYGLVFSTGYLTERDDPRFKEFYTRYLQQYALPPDEFAVQGYDLGRYLLQLLDQYRYGTVPLATYLRQAPPFRGLHLDLEFQGQQSNQLVNLGAYLEGGVRRVNRLPGPSLAEEVMPGPALQEWVPRPRGW
jgi:branched-chain amino acid transport system substrate-binding protein